MIIASSIKKWLIKKTAYENDLDKTLLPTTGLFVYLLDNIVPIFLTIGCIISSYIICVYEFDWFYKFPTNFSVIKLEGIKTILINISFSYLAGWIIYLLTVSLPKWEERRRLRPVLQDQANSIYNYVHRAVFRFYKNPNILDIEECISKMKSSNWNDKNQYPDKLCGKPILSSFLIDYAELVEFVEKSLQEYGAYYSRKQYRYLENIRRTNILYMYNIVSMPYAKIERRNIDLHILPAFRNVLLCNKKLNASFHDYTYYINKFKETLRKKIHHKLTSRNY